MKDIFKLEDFFDYNEEQFWSCTAASKANLRIQELIATWPKVYGRKPAGHDWEFSAEWLPKFTTHQAYLALIEELPKEPVKERCTHPVSKLKIEKPKFKCVRQTVYVGNETRVTENPEYISVTCECGEYSILHPLKSEVLGE